MYTCEKDLEHSDEVFTGWTLEIGTRIERVAIIL